MIVFANRYQKVTCKAEIQLRAQNVDTNLYSILNIIRGDRAWVIIQEIEELPLNVTS